ncbi:MAG: AsmA-like C-terminal region-containing protein [Verrucomicrobiota bacterium]
MPNTRPKHRFWRLCRIYFRRFRISIWVVTIIVLSAVLYLNRVGLPDFVKRPLVNKLRESGVALEFAQLRWHWGDGFVAHGVSFGSMNEPAAPQLLAEQVQIKLNEGALLHGRLQVDSLGLEGGRLQWIPLNSNTPIRALTAENIQARLRLLPGDQWRLDDLHARFAGADILVSASVTNATAIKDWDFLKGTSGPPTTQWPARLQKLADTLESISFSSPPELRLVFEGDARNPQSFGVRLNLNAARAETPWGQVEGLEFVSRLFPAATNELSRAEINLKAASAQTHWANTTNLYLQLRLVSLAPQPEAVDAALTLRASAAETPWAAVGPTQLKARWVHAVTNPIPQSGSVELATDMAITPWARAAGVQLNATLARPTNPIAPEASLLWWTNLLAYQLDWSANARAVKAFRLEVEDLRGAGQWGAPHLVVTNLQAKLYRGELEAEARLDVVTRELGFSAGCSFDLKQIASFLTGEARDWFAKVSWNEPPHLRCTGSFTLPAWADPEPDWSGEILPTLQLAGEVAATNLAFEGIYANSLRTHFTCTNRFWRLPDLLVERPEGRLELAHTLNEVTRDFYFQFRSSLDLTAGRSLLPTSVQEALDLCEFTAPPQITGELWVSGTELARLGFRGQLALTNFTFRQLNTDAIVTRVGYTNRVISFGETQAWRGAQTFTAAGLAADFNAGRVYVTNAYSTFDPRPVLHAVGPQVEEVMAPYHFLQPPTVHLEGYVPMENPQDADMIFEGMAAPFECLKFRVPRVTGRVHWLNNTLTITNVQAEFYGGDGTGWAKFFFPVEPGARFTFGVNTRNTNLRLLLDDLTSPRENLEGQFNLNLLITDADTENPLSWNGYGDAQLRDSLIWAIPIFGVLSKPLDAIMPGVGNSRVSSATASFVITNSVIRSDDLEMRSPAMRLQYRGTVDFDRNVRARVTAEPLRGTPVLGPVMNVALWPVTRLFQYKITGTLAEPKPEPVYIPKILLFPLAPFKTLEDLFTAGGISTNAPAEIKKAGEVPAR